MSVDVPHSLPDTGAAIELTVLRRRLVMLALALGGFAIGVAEFATMSILPWFSADFGVTEAVAGRAISAYAVGVCIGAPLIALLGSRVSRRTLLVGMMAYYGIINGLSIVAPSWGAFQLTRFLAGVPHGAFLGVAGVMAAALVPRAKRAQAVASVMLGLTIANIVGVPLANVFGAILGWRVTFLIVVCVALTCAVLVQTLAPRLDAATDASPLKELAALKLRQVWLTLAIGAIGTGGMFCVYTYLASVMIEYTGAPEMAVPVMLMVFGIGMTLGQVVFGRLAERSLMGSAALALMLSAVATAGFWAVAGNLWAIAPMMLAIGLSAGLSPVLQTRLMDLASDAPTLSSAMNHSAFNFANALGPWLGGIALSAGAGWPSIGLVGAGLSLAGLVILWIAVVDARPRVEGMPAE